MKRLLFLIILTASVSVVHGQQHSLYSNYIFNLHVINPAYAGARNAVSANAGVRHQWVGFEGAPRTHVMSVHSPLTRNSLSAGILVIHDELGPRKATMASFSLAYRLKLSAHERLSFGIQGGMLNYRFDPNMLSYAQTLDPVSLAFQGNHMMPNFDFGLMYHSKKAYAGISAMSMNGTRINDFGLSDARLEPVINLVAGKVFKMSETVSIKPSTLVRKGLQSAFLADANLGFLLKNTLWLTATYRHQFGMVFSTNCRIGDNIHVGYAYDWALNGLVAKQSGTHELYLGVEMNIHKAQVPSPGQF